MTEFRDNEMGETQPFAKAQPPVENEISEPINMEPPPRLTYYEIIYGILFDPVKTMQRIAQNPPLGATLIIVTLLSLAGLLADLYTSAHAAPAHIGLTTGLPLRQAMMLSEALRAAAPVLAVIGVIFYFVKWFFYSALLHLLAELYGGRGEAKTVFVIYGLASLPGVFLIPLKVLAALAVPAAATGIDTVGGFIVLIWGIILLAIGLKEAHNFTTGKALLVIFTPVVAVIVLGLVSLAGLMSALASFMPHTW
ncbi:hypothetical protein Desca_2658 [Desulfotomaculum nigrificans CO-1-SRB]|uniref:Yip1 domain-containing protein n=1 Tax=Desulfotomaculum nigrificans (strain DSM 14880 / VKM B-2319 / CO-1-SRB) TaxID=868595 RepID=F6B653_DESCC|nr:Yip1 family protein [Desulfotomaculum nigrificans]AEF95476.1 hypothetical protein Desca_2658 [Desulfotomaculum nigrificans CO-1-SRB]